MTISRKIKHIALIAVPLLKKHGVARAGIFGSYARGEERKQSDIDLLIKIRGKKSLLDIVRLQLELKKHLKKPVDVLEYQEVHPYIKKRILAEEVRIL